MAAAPTAREKTTPQPERERDAERTLRSDFDALLSRVAAAVVDQPFTATAVAAGVGFVIGGALTRNTLTVLMGAGARLAATWLGDEIRLRTAENLDSAKEND